MHYFKKFEDPEFIQVSFRNKSAKEWRCFKEKLHEHYQIFSGSVISMFFDKSLSEAMTYRSEIFGGFASKFHEIFEKLIAKATKEIEHYTDEISNEFLRKKDFIVY